MFIVSLTYVCELSEIEKHLADHIQYLDAYYAKGVFLASGRKEPRTGGVILAQMDSRAALDQVLEQDPFKINGLAHYDVIEFTPTKTCEALSFLCV
ncbi:GTP cyclohydrolase [Terasakiispira papahanaumokuakeensis]|uniref:GTP cyclohydrolase n=1 Tax=Terasakiispira papahanaumokuakeensis TaxID=197479 RepID=A0A1E2V7I3_9GAMM|nr:YciI family protein [Terasakiispira papahanaumokuakeensis]ODC02615.1 GTP cyclohydrolase [Terasakiispira papahanaumokuakeensis]